MKKVLLIDPFSGASGDMLLSALVSLGFPVEKLRDMLAAVPVLSNVKIEEKRIRRGLFEAVQLDLVLPREETHRSLGVILEIIETSDLPAGVKERVTRTFQRLAEAEAKVHGTSIEKVHFHEVGALDAIIDIFGFHSAVEHLNAESCYYTGLVLGSGSIQCAHGEIPIPAPATVELLTGHDVSFSERKGELITPTAAAVIATSFEPLPKDAFVRLEKVGYGAGTREGDGLPNVLRAILGSVAEAPRRVCIVTCTIDDMNPEVYGYLMEKLFDHGALEVYFNSVMMKKNRPGLEMTVITEEIDLDRISQFILSHTTTLGLRVNREERVELFRERIKVETPYGPVEVKVGRLPDGREKVSPEYESCRAAAEKTGASILDVFDAARIAWQKKGGEQPSQ